MGLFYLSATPECQGLPQDLALVRIHQMGKWSSERTVPCTLLLWHLPRFKSPHPGDPRCRLTHKPLFRHRLRLSLSSQGLWALHSLLVSSLENFVQCVLIIPPPHTHTHHSFQIHSPIPYPSTLCLLFLLLVLWRPHEALFKTCRNIHFRAVPVLLF